MIKIIISNNSNYFKQNLIRYEYRFIVAYQLSTIDMYLYRSGDEIHGFLNVGTQSANAVYRVWNSLKVASFDVTNKDFYDPSNRDN
ncbi:hypothetical protein [Spiroplasma endosymbiont of Glossina fuscipes fuscipes]|uniref:hypothetical protein n=1 Tax=Spiroplasma endosymbiont of Glossina fuscipes fuscipes TaxID=2004463 RepID=UPI003C73E329